jgi:hypothetical protein
MTDRPEIDDGELQRRVLYSLMLPVVRLARVFGVPLKELAGWLEVAYLHESREAGLSTAEISRLFGVSRRTLVELSRRLKANFFAPERHEGLPRRIEFMLWAGPMSGGRIRQSLSAVAPTEVDSALAQLVRDGRVQHRPGRTDLYQVPRAEFRLYRDDWLARIDGLNNHLASVASTVYARFFRAPHPAFSRTLNLRARPADLDALEALYRDVIFPRLAELDALARGADDAIDVDLTFHWVAAGALDDSTDPEETPS